MDPHDGSSSGAPLPVVPAVPAKRPPGPDPTVDPAPAHRPVRSDPAVEPAPADVGGGHDARRAALRALAALIGEEVFY